MHRVELKVEPEDLQSLHLQSSVPNAPCGVESRLGEAFVAFVSGLFLMHRVELKGWVPKKKAVKRFWFLMHRVELKDTKT